MTIPTRTDRERDWSDIAFLLTLIANPLATREELDGSKRLRKIAPLLDESHQAWRGLGDRARLGHAALGFLLEP